MPMFDFSRPIVGLDGKPVVQPSVETVGDTQRTTQVVVHMYEVVAQALLQEPKDFTPADYDTKNKLGALAQVVYTTGSTGALTDVPYSDIPLIQKYVAASYGALVVTQLDNLLKG